MIATLESAVESGQDYFRSSLDLSTGSKITVAGSTQEYTVILKEEVSADLYKYSIEPYFLESHQKDAEFSLIAPPNYLTTNESGEIIKFNGIDPFNFKAARDSDLILQFTSVTDFDSFSLLGFAEHKIEKSYPNIVITPNPSGANIFFFKFKNIIGSISLGESCDSCENFNIESFIVKGKIESLEELNNYLLNCGPSLKDKSNFKVQGVDLGEDYYEYHVSYCCSPELSQEISYCYLQWKINEVSCSSDDPTYTLHPVNLLCSSLKYALNKWIKISENEMVFTRRSHFCDTECVSSDVEPLLLVDPDPPSKLELLSICPQHVTTTTTAIPIVFSDEFSQHFGLLNVAHDEPLYSSSSLLVAQSSVNSSPYEEDLSARCFYKESTNGYFFEDQLPFLKDENGIEIQGEKYLNPENTDYTAINHYTYKNFDDYFFLKSDEPPETGLYHSVVGVGDVPTYTQEFNFIKDLSLFQKVFTHENKESPSLIVDNKVASLNFEYWFNELPKSIYESDTWWSELHTDNLPKFNLTFNVEDLSVNQFAFHNDSQELTFQPVFLNDSDDSYSEVFLKKLSNLFNLSKFSEFVETSGTFIDDDIFDFEYFFSPNSASRFLDISLSFSMALDESKISASTLEKLTTNTIARSEHLKIYLDLPFAHNYNFIEDFGVDKTLGVTSPKYHLIQDTFINLEETPDLT